MDTNIDTVLLDLGGVKTHDYPATYSYVHAAMRNALIVLAMLS